MYKLHRVGAARSKRLHRPESAERSKVTKTANIRLLWVSITNLAVLGLVLAGIEQQHDLRTLLAAPGRAPGLWQTLAGDRWNLVTIAVLLTGVLFEALRIRLAWLPNVGFYLCSLVAGTWGVVMAGNSFPREHTEAAVVFYLLPLGIILVVNSYLYWPRRRAAENPVAHP